MPVGFKPFLPKLVRRSLDHSWSKMLVHCRVSIAGEMFHHCQHSVILQSANMRERKPEDGTEFFSVGADINIRVQRICIEVDDRTCCHYRT